MTVSAPFELARTLLVVPGDRPERFARAVSSGADCIIVDLEDGVSSSQKEKARRSAVEWLGRGNHALVRINAPETTWFAADVAALAGRVEAVVLPKADSADQVRQAADALKVPSVLPLFESARGVMKAREICALGEVRRVGIGTADLATNLRLPAWSRHGLDHARSVIALESALAGIHPPVDGPSLEYNDAETVEAETRTALEFGYHGRMCIHPNQVPWVSSVLTPTSEEVVRAEQLLAAAGDGGATQVDGALVDKPVIEHARWVASRARTLSVERSKP